MPSFLPGFGVFAVAGLIAAAGPVIIHLLNRRRFRVLEWAAMEFLLEAVQRNRRILQLRDLLLLALRTACVLLFGLALARPFFASSAADFDPGQPVHAVMLVDNSLSMGYMAIDRTLLDEAKAKALNFIEDLPEGSRISIIPICGTPAGYSLDAYRTKEDAKDALEKIEVVDRSGSAGHAADLALEACQQAPELAKRVVLLGDQQRINWSGDGAAEQWKQLPELQVVEVTAEDVENSWISDFQVQDAVADVETSTTFTAILRHEGSASRTGVQVTLTVDGTDVATQTVDLEPGQALPVTFNYRFDVPVEPGQSSFVPARISLTSDRLPDDDVRHLAVPVVASLPVVFVDQYGEREKPHENLYGETHHLRRLLAPVTVRGDTSRQLVQVRHTTIDGLSREILQDARLVVLAGVSSPGSTVPLLRDYALQGGQVVIAAGADFDPATWTAEAWLDGEGILPAPLLAEPIGRTPSEVDVPRMFQLAFDNRMEIHEYFALPEVPKLQLADLYEEPYFFKAVQSNVSDTMLKGLWEIEARRLREQLSFLAESEAQRKEWAELEARGRLDEAARQARELDELRRAEIEPNWLLWENQREESQLLRLAATASGDDQEQALEELVRRSQPRVLAAFDNQVPFLIERAIGRGRVLLVSTGVFSEWNTLPRTNAVLIYDRILRSMLESTLPRRNYETLGQVTLPVRAGERRGRFVLKRPDGSEEELFVEAQQSGRFGLTVRDLSRRGVYAVRAYSSESAADEGLDNRLWEIPLAVNGPGSESEPQSIDEAALAQRLTGVDYRWIGPNAQISLQGARVSGQDLWWWLILLVLVLLLVELVILAWPTAAQERTA